MNAPRSFDFSEGFVAQNIITSLAFLEIPELSQLYNEGKIRRIKKDPWITARCLYYSALDDYSKATQHSLRYFLFGSEAIQESFYSPYDSDVINVLNMLSDVQLECLRTIAYSSFHSPLMDAPPDLTPNERFFLVLTSRLNSKVPSAFPENELYKYRRDVLKEFQRYKSVKYNKKFFFHSDYWVDLATYVGVSVRWILGVKETTLHCQRPVADDIFDLYTLMAPVRRFAFIGLLMNISPVPVPEFEKLIYEGGDLP